MTECPACKGKLKSKEGSVYGKPEVKMSLQVCVDCGRQFQPRHKGIEVFDEFDVKTETKNAARAKDGDSK